FRPRPIISVRSLAGQLTHTRGQRDQVDPLRTCVPSVCGTVDRDDTAGGFLPPADLGRPPAGAEAGRAQELLQRASLPPVPQGPHSGRNVWQTAAVSGRPYPLRMAAPLPRSVPDADRGVIYEFAIDRVRRSSRLPPRLTRVSHATTRNFQGTIPPRHWPLKLRKGHRSQEVRDPAIRPVHGNSRRCHPSRIL